MTESKTVRGTLVALLLGASAAVVPEQFIGALERPATMGIAAGLLYVLVRFDALERRVEGISNALRKVTDGK